MDSTRAVTRSLIVAIVVALAATASPALARSHTLRGPIKDDVNGRIGTISMRVVFKDGKPKFLKETTVKVNYYCGDLYAGKTPDAVLKFVFPKIPIYQINGHPSFRKRATENGHTWDLTANMPNNKGRKAIGGLIVTGTNSQGEECRNSYSAQFTARKV